MLEDQMWQRNLGKYKFRGRTHESSFHSEINRAGHEDVVNALLKFDSQVCGNMDNLNKFRLVFGSDE